MKRQVIITTQPIDEAALIAGRAADTDAGAVVTFLGVVRGREDGQPIQALEYEAFKEMAEHQFELILQEVEKRWPVRSVRVVHRVGVINVGEASLWIEVRAAHRGEVFATCQYLIDELKRVVPIWKRPVG